MLKKPLKQKKKLAVHLLPITVDFISPLRRIIKRCKLINSKIAKVKEKLAFLHFL